jgi:cyclopropane-fatty-acyl-phospholipid synthase
LARLAYKLRVGIKRLDQYNPVHKAKKNVAHHYDLSGTLYDLFLDRDRQYSCAYFENSAASLEDAQLAKKRHLAAKLGIKPGMKVLDIGSGWGGLGLYLAETCGAQVTGVTLSEEQHKLSNARAQQRGLAERAQFRLLDYRNLNEPFDRIVSVGMFEHVGVGHYKEFFAKCRALLKDDGVAVLHSINRSDGPGATSAWIKKYIFPGGYIPALSEVLPHLERGGLYVTDIEILRLHYAETLREWGRRFQDHRDKAKEIYDERFCRMWEFYLAASEASFRFAGMNNFQIQFVKNQNVLPLSRNYMIEQEELLLKEEAKRPRFKSVAAE